MCLFWGLILLLARDLGVGSGDRKRSIQSPGDPSVHEVVPLSFEKGEFHVLQLFSTPGRVFSVQIQSPGDHGVHGVLPLGTYAHT